MKRSSSLCVANTNIYRDKQVTTKSEGGPVSSLGRAGMVGQETAAPWEQTLLPSAPGHVMCPHPLIYFFQKKLQTQTIIKTILNFMLGLLCRLSWWRIQRIHLQCRRPRFNPWAGKIPWRRVRQPTPVFSPRKPMDRRAGGYSPCSCNKMDTCATAHAVF